MFSLSLAQAESQVGPEVGAASPSPCWTLQYLRTNSQAAAAAVDVAALHGPAGHGDERAHLRWGWRIKWGRWGDFPTAAPQAPPTDQLIIVVAPWLGEIHNSVLTLQRMPF